MKDNQHRMESSFHFIYHFLPT